MKKLVLFCIFMLGISLMWKDGNLSIGNGLPKAVACWPPGWAPPVDGGEIEGPTVPGEAVRCPKCGAYIRLCTCWIPPDIPFDPLDPPDPPDLPGGGTNPPDDPDPCTGPPCPVCGKLLFRTKSSDNCEMCEGHPEEEKDPCEKVSKISKNKVINEYMDSLIKGRMAAEPNKEHGDLIREDGSWQEKTSSENSTEYSFEPETKYTHSLHTHPDNGDVAYVSGGDLFCLLELYSENRMVSVDDFVFGVFNSNSSMYIKIEDADKFLNYMENFGMTGKELEDELKEVYIDKLKLDTPQTSFDDILLNLATFCDEMGLETIVSASKENDTTDRGWSKYNKNSNNTIEKIDCK